MFYDVRIKTHFFGGQRQVVLVFTNVSAEKELQRELAMKDLTKVMFASINHELRTPCNAITNGLQLMRPFLNRASLKYYDICTSSVKFLLSLVNDTLDFAQLQAGKFKMNFEMIDVRATVDEVLQLMNVQLRTKEDVYLINSVPVDIPEQMELDSQRLKQILINLMRNATKFTFKGFI